MSTTKDFTNERMRFIIFESNETLSQEVCNEDHEVSEPAAKKVFHPLSQAPHLVQSLKRFLKWAIDYSNLELFVSMHLKDDDENTDTDICHGYGRMHYHLIIYSSKFPKTMDRLIKKNFVNALEETMDPERKYQVEMFSSSSVGFKKDFLRNTKTLFTHGPTIQQQLTGLNQSSNRGNVDCIWEKSHTFGRSSEKNQSVVNRTEMHEALDKLEKSSSQFKHTVPDILNFLAENNYGEFTTSIHSSRLTMSVDVTNAQCNCDECFPIYRTESKDTQTFQYFDENTILFESSISDNFS